jgi:hypothetical protein
VSNDRPTPAQEAARLYEESEAATAKAMERMVSSEGFGVVLARLAENAAAIAKLGADGMDLVLRNFRVAGRSDVIRLGRQLARTEDKLERVLQEVEELRAEMRSSAGSEDRKPSSGRSRNRRTNARSAGNSRSEDRESANR